MHKTIIKKSTNEYAIYNGGQFYTSTCPQIIAETATPQALKDYAKSFDNVDLDLSDYEIIEIEIIRKDLLLSEENKLINNLTDEVEKCCGRCIPGLDDCIYEK